MKNMTLSNIAAACNGKYYGSEADINKVITGVERTVVLLNLISVSSVCWKRGRRT